MASRETLSDAPLSALATDINTDPKARAAWIEVAAARMAARLLRDARERKGLSQAAVARALGVSQARISQVESGRVDDIPPLDLMMRFIDACGDELRLATAATLRETARTASPRPAQPVGTPIPMRAPAYGERVAQPSEDDDDNVATAAVPVRRDYAGD